MAYHALADVKAEFRGIDFTATSIVTDTTVNSFIAQTEALINGRLYNKYTVPITGTDSLAIVKRIAIGLTAGRVDAVLRKNGIQATNGDEETRMSNMTSGAMADLKKIATDDLILYDAVLVGALSTSVGIDPTSNGTSGNAGTGINQTSGQTFPIVKKGVKQW